MHLSGKRIDDELDVLRGNSLDGFLYDVVPILVLDTFQYLVLEFLDK